MPTSTAHIAAEATTCLGLSGDLPGIVKSYFSEGLDRIQSKRTRFLFDPIYVVYRGFSFSKIVLNIVLLIQQILTLIKHYVFDSFQAMLDKDEFSPRPTGLSQSVFSQEEWSGLFLWPFLSLDGVVGSNLLASVTNNSKSRVNVSMSNLKDTVLSPDPDDDDNKKRRNSDQEEFVSHKSVKNTESEQFTAFKSRSRKSSHNPGDIVQSDDEFVAEIHTKKVTVIGSEVIEFVKACEKKIQDYNDQPYYRLLRNGVLSKKRRTFDKYVLGAAICKHYGLDVRRFVEAQYHYHDSWRGSAPNISYIVSLNSAWNSVGRYKSYCEKFKRELNYFEAGVDNVEQAYRTKRSEVKIETPNANMVEIYEDMINHQMQTLGLSRKQVLWILGNPESGYIPWQYLKSLPLYQELVDEQAWGKEDKKMGFYRKIKSYRE